MLPEIYHRFADKTPFYMEGGLGKKEPVFTIRDSKEHAIHRKIIATDVSFCLALNIIA